jgi:hypothetical protein
MSLRSSLNNVLGIWLGHADARQVCGLPWSTTGRTNGLPNGSAMLMRSKSSDFFRTPLSEELQAIWLGHADARQVFDLPSSDTEFQAVSDRQVDI